MAVTIEMREFQAIERDFAQGDLGFDLLATFYTEECSQNKDT